MWDLIYCRELYPFTRTNYFTEQHSIISRLIDSLKPGGALVVITNTMCYPNCLDLPLLINELNKDGRLRCVSRRYLDGIIRLSTFNLLPFNAYLALWLMALPIISWKRKYQNWGAGMSYMVALIKK